MKNSLLLFCLLFVVQLFSQQTVTWKDLANITFSEKYFPEYDEPFLHPDFGVSVQKLNGKKITVQGYFLNLDPEGNVYMLSKTPMASCFFCGMGGPETAIELQFNGESHFKTDQIVRITGTFKLNNDDLDHCNYILTHCKGKLVK